MTIFLSVFVIVRAYDRKFEILGKFENPSPSSVGLLRHHTNTRNQSGISYCCKMEHSESLLDFTTQLSHLLCGFNLYLFQSVNCNASVGNELECSLKCSGVTGRL